MLSQEQKAKLEEALTTAFRNELIAMRDASEVTQADMCFIYEKSHISISLPATLEERQKEYLDKYRQAC